MPNTLRTISSTFRKTDQERLARALPFPSSTYSLEFGRNYLSLGALLFQRGYLDQAEQAFQQAFRDDPSSAEALYGVGSVYLNQNKNAAAREAFERAVKLTASYPTRCRMPGTISASSLRAKGATWIRLRALSRR